MVDFLETTPADDIDFGLIPANERLHRLAWKTAWDTEHDEATGYHKFQLGNEAAEDAIVGPTDGQIFLRTDIPNPGIDRHDTALVSNKWRQAASRFEAAMVWDFYQAAAPEGWVFLAGQDDTVKYLAAVVTDGGFAGPPISTPGFGSDWAFTSVVGSGTTSLEPIASDEIPVHKHTMTHTVSGDGAVENHQIGYSNSDGALLADKATAGPGNDSHDHNYGALATVSNVGDVWRPKHSLWIPCTKAAVGV